MIMFNAETLDTFCFRWPAFHCYVLVRVLDHYDTTTIALLPLRSRRAFLYFHHAPLPHQPTNFATIIPAVAKQRKTSRIQAMFHPWKHTLALSEQSSLHSTDSNGSSSSSSRSTSSSYSKGDDGDDGTYDNDDRDLKEHKIREKQQRRQDPEEEDDDDNDGEEKQEPEVTLANVLEHVQDRDGWIQAPCTVSPSIQDPNAVILETTNNKTEIVLVARSTMERQMFINLVLLSMSKLDRHRRTGTTKSHIISTHELVQRLEKQCQQESADMLQLAGQVTRAKKEIASYTDQLNKLDRSSMQLASSIQEFQSMDEQAYRVLQAIQEQLEILQQDFYAFRHRMHRLDLWLTANPDIVGAARLRLMLDHVHVSPSRYWFLYLMALIVVVVAIVAFWKQ